MVALNNIGSTYDAIVASNGLGIAEIDFTGVTSVVFRVRVSKVGTGTQSWQLWNDDDAAEIARFDDAGAGGVKTLGPTTVPVSLMGVKTVRVRAKSTTSTDDPVFLGASVRLVRG